MSEISNCWQRSKLRQPQLLLNAHAVDIRTVPWLIEKLVLCTKSTAPGMARICAGILRCHAAKFAHFTSCPTILDVEAARPRRSSGVWRHDVSRLEEERGAWEVPSALLSTLAT